jgi:hypothetical protein
MPRAFLRSLLALAGALVFSTSALAIEVNGINVDETAKVGNVELKLNGAGVRTKLVVSVYVAALYLPEKKSTTAEVLAVNGPRRMALHILREVSSDSMSQALIDGLNNNTSSEEKSQFFNQMLSLGKIFGAYRSIKPKDVVTIDWIPGTGTVIQMNGKRLAEPLPDQDFYNALLRIWLGDKPADRSLKPKLLGVAR